MKQVVQDVRSGRTGVRLVPDPAIRETEVLVGVAASAVSAGTERFVVDLARKSLIGKARQRPDDVRRVFQKVRQEGLVSTLNQVSAKLDEPMPLGYSAAGLVIECGRNVQDFKPGDRVAVAGPHAAVVAVGRNLCAKMPDDVSFDRGAYTSIGAIALQGVRLAHLGIGDRVLVIGLGLIGQMVVCLLKAQGCRVFGSDINEARLQLALSLGADGAGLGVCVDKVNDFAGTAGVDAVVLTAATSSNEPIEFAAAVCRQKGRIILIGTAGLEIPRAPFFKKELEFTVSSSLGPGRGDPQYEEKGVDYPVGYARWTTQRNMAAVLDIMASGQLPVDRLTTHRFPIESAPEAYDLITQNKLPYLGIVIDYPQSPVVPERRIDFSVPGIRPQGRLGVSMIGAGNFARLILMPILVKHPEISWRGLCTVKGLNAEHSGRKMGFAFATTDVEEICQDASTHAVLIATRHDIHKELVLACLRAGKHVFVEKPLCIRPEELDEISRTVYELGTRCPLLMVGFNRRFAPAIQRVRQIFRGHSPLSVSYRFAPGYVPPDSWTQDMDVGGGRIIGEACHAIDTCASITGSNPVRVFAESVARDRSAGPTDDSVFITMRHQDGSISSVSYQSGGDQTFPAERIEVFGAGKVAVIDAWDSLQVWSGGRSDRTAANKDKGHQNELKAFVDSCRSGGPWPVLWDQTRASTWASLAAVHSLRCGEPVVEGPEHLFEPWSKPVGS